MNLIRSILMWAVAAIVLSTGEAAAQACSEQQLSQSIDRLPEVIEFEAGEAVAAFSSAYGCEFVPPRLAEVTGGENGRIIATFDGLDVPVVHARLSFERPFGYDLAETQDHAIVLLANSFGSDYIEVEFWSEPDNADVIIGGQSRGATVRRLTLREGVIKDVVIRLAGYKDCDVGSFKIDFTPGVPKIACTLTPTGD